MDVQPILLEGEHVRLEPLSIEDHLEDPQEAGSHEHLFEWYDRDYASPAGIREFVEIALSDADDGTAVPFATVHRASDRVVGTTRFGNVVPAHRRVEVGWTWITPAFQRTAVNTEAKYLMFRHAFET